VLEYCNGTIDAPRAPEGEFALTVRAAARKGRKMTIFKDVSKNYRSYLLALPAMIYVFIFTYCTLPYMAVAFQKFSYKTGLFNSEFVGLKNFEVFVSSNRMFQVAWNTIKLNFLFLLFGTVIAVFFAMLLSEINGKLFKKMTQSIFIFPHFLSWVIVSYIVMAVFSMDRGLINKIVVALGGDPYMWYNNPKPWTWIMVGLRVWKSTGINSVIFLAAITAVDTSLYEAAYIDGAGTVQRALRITLPLIMPTVLTLTLLNIGRFFYGDFGMIYAIIRDNGVLYPTTDIIDTFVFRLLRRTGDPSQAMAVGMLQSILGFTLVFATNAIARKNFEEGALF
jgi:putative aldouronate transport system permease protein